MERLTIKFPNGYLFKLPPVNDKKAGEEYISKLSDKLGAYEDAEEQDLLLKLPCKVGNELFLSDYPTIHCRLKEYKFIGNEVAIVIDCWEWQRTCTRMLSDFGKTVFLTKEEAEKALEQMKAGGV